MNTTTEILKKEPSSFYRWTVLVFISFAMFGNYYIYDSISPLADLLVKQLHFTDSDIGLLQAIYSIPNIIMVLIGGLLIDKIGTGKSVLIFTALVMIGALVTAIKGDIVIMATGRLIFGLGAESMIVAITTVLARWFKGKELSFAFGINLTIARLGSFLALNSPSWGKSLYNYWQSPLWITVAAGILAMIFIFIYLALDKYALKHFSLAEENKQDKIVFKELFNFSKSFWYITALCVTFYSAMFPFQTFAIKYFQDAHGTSREVGGNLSSILTLAAMIFTPLFGILADKIGKRSLLMMFGSLLIIPVYLMMAYKFGKPDLLTPDSFINIQIDFFDIHAAIPKYLLLPMSMMGIAFSLIPAVMWPSVAYIIDEKRLGTAYGLMTMIQQIGLAGFNLLIGFTNDAFGASSSNPAGYNTGLWFFSVLGFLGLLFSYLLRKFEMSSRGHGLEKAMGKN